MDTFDRLELEASSQRGGKPAIPSIPAKHAEHCPSMPKDSAVGSLTETFILKRNAPLHLHFVFTDQILGKTPLSPQLQGRGVLQCGCRLSLSLCLPVAAHVLQGCCLFPAESCSPMALSTPLPRWGFSCSHLHPELTPIAQGDCLSQKTGGLMRGYKGMSYQFQGLHGLQFVLPMVHQEVPQETSVC